MSRSSRPAGLSAAVVGGRVEVAERGEEVDDRVELAPVSELAHVPVLERDGGMALAGDGQEPLARVEARDPCAVGGEAAGDPALSAGHVEHPSARLERQQAGDHLRLGVAARVVEDLLVEVHVVVVEHLGRDAAVIGVYCGHQGGHGS
jgi:hypothetical protein